MENFQGIHASVITALRCSKTRVWNSANPQIFSRTPELHTRNSAGLRTLDWNTITWQNSRPGIPPDSRTLIPESAGLQNSEPGIHRNPEFRVSVTRNSGGLRPESKPDLEFCWNSAGIPGLFLLGCLSLYYLKSEQWRIGINEIVYLKVFKTQQLYFTQNNYITQEKVKTFKETVTFQLASKHSNLLHQIYFQ